MGRPPQQVDVFTIQDRRAHGKGRPWVVRWRVEGQQRTRSFRTRTEADRYRSLLVHAITQGEPFGLTTGEPSSWLPGVDDDLGVYEWVRRWLAEQWPEWQPRTRRSAVEALTRFVPLVVGPDAPPPPPSLRRFLKCALGPGLPAESDGECESWLARNCLKMRDLDKQVLAKVDLQLGAGDDGQPLAATTASRRRMIARACVRRAVQLDVLSSDPWPPAPEGRSRRKIHRKGRGVDVRLLPDPAIMVRILDAMANHQPGSRTYQLMTAVVYYAGLRPSEVVMVRRQSLRLPADGSWGRIDVTEADIDHDVPGEPKTGPRSVPIPPVLVGQLQCWIDLHAPDDDSLLFRTRTGGRPTSSNWSRSWHRALDSIGAPRWRIYDCRHAAATTWLASGAPLAEVARRLGHTVDTLVSTYVGALTGDETLTNERIAATLDAASPSDIGDAA